MISVTFQIPAPSAAASNSWLLPNSAGDRRAQRISLTGGPTGSFDAIYRGTPVTIAVADSTATVQAAVNAAWAPFGVVITVGGAAGNWNMQFTSWDGVLPDPIVLDDSSLVGGTSKVTTDKAWLGSGVIDSLRINNPQGGAALTTTVRIYDAADIKGKAILSLAVPTPTGQKTYLSARKGQLAASTAALATHIPTSFAELFLPNNDVEVLPALETNGQLVPVWQRAFVASNGAQDIGAHCPHGMVVHITSSGAHSTTQQVTVDYQPTTRGQMRLKNSAYGAQPTRYSPISN